MTIDLHTHSNRSDGALTPQQLVASAALAGVGVLALTDHDTIDGLEEAQTCAAAAGIKLVAGVEISAGWRAQAIHVLGLWIDPAHPQLLIALAEQAALRRARMRNICVRLEQQGLPGLELLARVEGQAGLPTRSHLAQAMVAAGHVATTDEAFRKYLKKGKAAHIAADWPPLAQVIGWITAAGGVASLAHPIRYDISAGARRHLLSDFAAAGGTCLEVISGGNGRQHADACATLAVKYGLQGSVGSDFHDSKLSWNPLGRSLKLPDCVTPVWRRFGL